MNDRDTQILKKIYEHIQSILDYCQSCSDLTGFEGNNMRVEACVFNLMQIGELAKMSLSEEAKAQIKTIPWKQIYGMRNRIVHGYVGVEMKIVWDTIQNDLPILKAELDKYISKNETSGSQGNI